MAVNGRNDTAKFVRVTSPEQVGNHVRILCMRQTLDEASILHFAFVDERTQMAYYAIYDWRSGRHIEFAYARHAVDHVQPLLMAFKKNEQPEEEHDGFKIYGIHVEAGENERFSSQYLTSS